MGYRFLPDERLYTDRAYCLAEFEAPAPVPTGRLVYHTFWRGRISRHHVISLKSLAAVASQPYEIWLWMNEYDLVANRPNVPRFVKLRVWNPVLEAEGTILDRADMLPIFNSPNPVPAADIFRYTVLRKWGGFFFDLDHVFLADPRPLASLDFAPQWSNRRYGNDAFMHLRRGAKAADEIHRRVVLKKDPHPRVVFDFGEPFDEDLLVLPTFLNDPVWVDHDQRRASFDDFFAPTAEKVSLATWFPGAYAYHWHNRWDRPIDPRAPIGQLAAELDHRVPA